MSRIERGPLWIAGACALVAAGLVVSIILGLRGAGPLAGRVHSSWPYLGSGASGVSSGGSASRTASESPGAAGPGGGPGASAPGAARLAPGQSPGLFGPGVRGFGGIPGPGQPALRGPCLASVQTDQASYPRGTMIQIGVIIADSSSTPCSVAIGPGAPTFYVLDSQGHQIWGGCDAPNGAPIACSGPVTTQQILPGGVFTASKSWNQARPPSPGAAPAQVPPGTYTVGYGKPGTAYTSTITIS